MIFFSRLVRLFRSLPRARLHRPFGVTLEWGHDNSAVLDGRLTGAVRFKGSLNRVEMPKSSSFSGHILVRGTGNRILIGENCKLAGEIIVKGSKQTVTIGEGTTFESVYVLCLEHCDVTIGRWCMFSRGIEVRSSDSHSLIDRKSGRRLNSAAPVIIGDHVWVGVGTILNKGTVIADDCIVGAKSFVNKAFSESGVLLAGTPAKIIKRGVTWDRQRRRRFSVADMEKWRHKPDDQ